MTNQQDDNRVSLNIPYYSSYSSCQGAFWASDKKINRVNRVDRVAYGVSESYCWVRALAAERAKTAVFDCHRDRERRNLDDLLEAERQRLAGWLDDLVVNRALQRGGKT